MVAADCFIHLLVYLLVCSLEESISWDEDDIEERREQPVTAAAPSNNVLELYADEEFSDSELLLDQAEQLMR